MAMEGSCSNSSANCNGSICSWMGFGGNSDSGVCPTMMMPLVTSNHAGHYPINPNLNNPNHPNPNQHTNSLFPMPFPTINNNNNNDHYPNPNRNRNCNSSDNKMLENNHNHNMTNSTGLGYFMEINHANNDGSASSSSSSSAVKAKIMGHPHYHRLLAAYVNCQKVGAPPEVVARLEEACASAAGGGTGTGCSIGEDPALDQFMEAYCEMLNKYQQELSKPFNEATLFLQRIESQFKSLTLSSSDFGCEAGRNNGSAEDVDGNNNMIDPEAEDQELKVQLLRKYSGYLGSLKQEFMKKRKKGKLPKEARQQLLEWWSRHYKWPYPSESQKLALAEATGLDQKQINNWFINQRKRHWKPSEDMQFVVVDPSHPHYYMDTVLANPFPMDLSHTML